MRWLVFWLFLELLTIPASAAKPVTVAQLEQKLAVDQAAHKSDADTARQVSSIELSERLTEEALSRLRQPFARDSRTATALLLLADRSAFLDPPANELPANPPPGVEGQQHLLAIAHKFAVETLPQLPNLLATRTTFSFDDSPQELEPGAYPQRVGMHLIGSSKGEVSVNRERTGQASGKPETTLSRGLTSWGEFGSALLIILSDSAQGKTTWSHWESTPAGMLAVFHYEVPKSASHFEIDTSVQEIQANGESIPWAGARSRDAGAVSMWNRNIRSRPGYQGSLWIDPTTGTITRLTLVADLKGNPRFDRGAILVEYGPVQIANKSLVCPLRSLALSEAPVSVNSTIAGAPTEWVNENLFNDYHLFSSTSRILPEEAAATLPSPVQAPSDTIETAKNTESVDTSALPATLQQDASGENHTSQPESNHSQTVPANASAKNEPTDRNRANTEAPPKAESLASEVTAQPATQPIVDPSSVPSSDNPVDTPKLRVEAQELLVPVVVRDKQGHAVGNLTKDDFTLFDQGKAKPIRGFSLIASALTGEPDHGAGATVPPSDAPDDRIRLQAQRRFIIFLFDDRHVDAASLVLAQKAATGVLNKPLADSDYAAVLSLSGANSGVTKDPVTLKTSIAKLSVHAASQHGKEDCPDVDYYAANKIMRQHDPTEFQLAVQKAKRCSHLKIFLPTDSQNLYDGMDNPTDPFQRMATAAANRALAQGDEDAHQTLMQIEAVVRAMTKLQGQRIIILLSPGFQSPSPDAMAFKSQILDEAVRANVVINALDVRGLYVGNPDASQGESAALSQTNGETASDHLAGMQASEDAMSEVANGTGGTFFHNNNDLLGGLNSLAAAPEYVYLLGVSLGDVKANGAFHQLKVKVKNRELYVQARRGYIAPKR